MSINFSECTIEQSLQDETTWQDLYISLQPLAKRIVYAFRVPTWSSQADDIAEDIVQETAKKLLERTRKAERKEALPIYALKPMARVIAYNYGKDMRRHDQRICRMPEQDDFAEQQKTLDEVVDTEEYATENAYREVLFTELAQEIADFPLKQRQALLIDLATRMSFEQQPTPLQKAFLKAGIQLQEYRHLLPATSEERNKYTSLLAHAYKRIAALSCAQAYRVAENGDSLDAS